MTAWQPSTHCDKGITIPAAGLPDVTDALREAWSARKAEPKEA